MPNLKCDDINKQNLISVLFALECVVTAVSKFADDEFKKLHGKIKQTLPSLCHKCTKSCSTKFPKDPLKWCNTCLKWQTSILGTHTDRLNINQRGTDWSTIDSSKWPSDYKEMEKCFNPQWYNAAKARSFNEDDVSVIIGKLINCIDIRQLFHSSVYPDQIRWIRNTIHHTYEIKVHKKQKYCKLMLDFVQTSSVWAYPEAQDAFNKILVFKDKSYQDILKDKIIDEHELHRMEKKIISSWGNCYNISITSMVLVGATLTLPLVIMFIQEAIDFLQKSRVGKLLSTYGSSRSNQDCPSLLEHEKYQNITVISLLVLVIILLVPLVILCIKELEKTRYYPYAAVLLGNMFLMPSFKEGASDDISVVTRREWEGKEPKKSEYMPSPIGNVFVHHTGGPFYMDKQGCSKRVRYIQDLHMVTNGWDDIGYNFLIGEDGRVYEGRGWKTVGAHTLGWNRNSVCFAFMGDFNYRRPNQRALKAFNSILQKGVVDGKLSPKYTVYGHRDKRPTDSPGHYLYAIITHSDHFHKKAMINVKCFS